MRGGRGEEWEGGREERGGGNAFMQIGTHCSAGKKRESEGEREKERSEKGVLGSKKVTFYFTIL